jgi:glucose-1-phosphate cytidylyltransferase
MKVVILAGGLGTRLAEETESRPKPMVEIGSQPILWHIMKYYVGFGFREFVIALGYKGDMIKRYFLDRATLGGDVSISLADGLVSRHRPAEEDWTVHLVETGSETQTGGRLRRLKDRIGDETFMLTYGDGVSNIDLKQLLDSHRESGKKATISAVRPPSRFGALTIDRAGLASFSEKPQVGEGWISGGFMVVEPEVLDLIDGDATSFESDVLEKLAEQGEMNAYQHGDFWQCVDTMRDLHYLRSLWERSEAPWATWI